MYFSSSINARKRLMQPLCSQCSGNSSIEIHIPLSTEAAWFSFCVLCSVGPPLVHRLNFAASVKRRLVETAPKDYMSSPKLRLKLQKTEAEKHYDIIIFWNHFSKFTQLYKKLKRIKDNKISQGRVISSGTNMKCMLSLQNIFWDIYYYCRSTSLAYLNVDYHVQ